MNTTQIDIKIYAYSIGGGCPSVCVWERETKGEGREWRQAGRSTGMEVRVMCEFVINAVREIHTCKTHSSHGIHISQRPAGSNVYLCLCVWCDFALVAKNNVRKLRA